MAKTRLTIKQEKFCNKYLECGNASEAYRFAYDCSNMGEGIVWRRASELLNNGVVAVRIKALQDELSEKNLITKERILTELVAILDSRISDYVNLVTTEVEVPMSEKEVDAGMPPQYITVQKLVFKDFSELTDKQIKAIESIKQGRNGIELKLHGKSWTIERINAMLGYNAPEKIEHAGKDGNAIEVDTKINYAGLSDSDLLAAHNLVFKALNGKSDK